MNSQHVNAVKQWLERRKVKGIHPNADEVWTYIRKRWPKLNEEEQERIFQAT